MSKETKIKQQSKDFVCALCMFMNLKSHRYMYICTYLIET